MNKNMTYKEYVEKVQKEYLLMREIVLLFHYCLCCRANGNFKLFMNYVSKILCVLEN